jgi:hypothetical protein
MTLLAVAAAMGQACSDSVSSASPTAPTTTAATATTTTPATETPTTPTTPTGTAAVYARFGGSVSVEVGATEATLRTTDTPDHTSPYWGVGSALYEAPHSGMRINPHRIATQSIVMRVTLSPAVASPSDTPLGAIGVATNGVVFFNHYAAGRSPLHDEIVSFDRQNGHPSPSNQYHYHMEPYWLTSANKSALIGVLLDGFPVYGPLDRDGSTPSDLDVCHGHVTPTAEFPNGMYHYHANTAAPYISGCFRGTRGTIGG